MESPRANCFSRGRSAMLAAMKSPRFGSALLFVAAFALRAAAAAPLPAVVDYAGQHADGRVAFSFNAGAYQGDLSSLPIGVFDSGIGGLTVLEAIYQLDAFNNETHAPGADGKPVRSLRDFRVVAK